MRLARSSGRALRQASSTNSASAEAICRACLQRRGLAVASSSEANSATPESPAAATRLFELLEQVAPEQKQWRKRLDLGLLSQSQRATSKKLKRITVIGSASSDVNALVSSLVQDPLHPDLLVQERHEHRGPANEAAPLLLSPDAGSVSNAISTPSPWLSNNAFEIVECKLNNLTLVPEDILDAALSSDILLLSFADTDDPTACASLLKTFRAHPAMLVTCNTLLSNDPSEFKQKLDVSYHIPTMLPYDGRAGRRAVESMRTVIEGTDLAEYSFQLTESRTPMIADALSECAASSEDAPPYALTHSLEALEEIVLSAQAEALAITDACTSIRRDAGSSVRELRSEIGLAKPVKLSQYARDQGKAVFDYALRKRLAWWKLPFGRADDVLAELGQAAAVAWRQHESETLFAAGRLEGKRVELDASVQALTSSGPMQMGSPFHSAILQNMVQQTAESGTNRISSELALEPYEQRRRQLMGPGGLAEHAARSAQNIVLTNYLLSLGTSAASYMSVAADVSTIPTAVSGGALGLVFAAWRLQNGWEKVKRRFLKNLDRLQDGLETDLETLADVASEKATGKTDQFLGGIEVAADQREARLREAHLTLQSCKQELSAYTSKEL